MAGWKSGGGAAKNCIFVKIMPLRGPSCKLRLARFSAKLKFQDGVCVAKMALPTKCFQKKESTLVWIPF
jgi:hypothetical protein